MGYLTAGMLVEEFRIAYRGWENMEEDMQRVAQRMRPNLGDGLSEEMRVALVALKAEAAKEREATKLQTELEAAWAFKEQEQDEGEDDNESSTNERDTESMNEKSHSKMISSSISSANARTKVVMESPPVSSSSSSSPTTQASPVDQLHTTAMNSSSSNTSSGKNTNRGNHSDDDAYLSNRKVDIEGFARHKIGKRPTIGDGLSDQMKAIIEQMKKEAE